MEPQTVNRRVQWKHFLTSSARLSPGSYVRSEGQGVGALQVIGLRLGIAGVAV